jgi:hypothetical protein
MGAGVSADDGGYVRVNPTRSQGYEVSVVTILCSSLFHCCHVFSVVCWLLCVVCCVLCVVSSLPFSFMNVGMSADDGGYEVSVRCMLPA